MAVPDPGHRVGGLSGPTRRYAVIVIMLVTMSSLPIIAILGTGVGRVEDADDPGGTTPFIAQPSAGPVVVLPPPTALPAPIPVGVAQSMRIVADPPSATRRKPRERPPRRKPAAPPRPKESTPATPPPPPIATPSLTPPPVPEPTPPLPPTPSLPCPTVPRPGVLGVVGAVGLDPGVQGFGIRGVDALRD